MGAIFTFSLNNTHSPYRFLMRTSGDPVWFTNIEPRQLLVGQASLLSFAILCTLVFWSSPWPLLLAAVIAVVVSVAWVVVAHRLRESSNSHGESRSSATPLIQALLL